MYYQNIKCVHLAQRCDKSFIELDTSHELLIVPTNELTVEKIRHNSEFSLCQREIAALKSDIVYLEKEKAELSLQVKKLL